MEEPLPCPAEPCQAEPSRAMPSRAWPRHALPSRAWPSRSCFPSCDLPGQPGRVLTGTGLPAQPVRLRGKPESKPDPQAGKPPTGHGARPQHAESRPHQGGTACSPSGVWKECGGSATSLHVRNYPQHAAPYSSSRGLSRGLTRIPQTGRIPGLRGGLTEAVAPDSMPRPAGDGLPSASSSSPPAGLAFNYRPGP